MDVSSRSAFSLSASYFLGSTHTRSCFCVDKYFFCVEYLSSINSLPFLQRNYDGADGQNNANCTQNINQHTDLTLSNQSVIILREGISPLTLSSCELFIQKYEGYHKIEYRGNKIELAFQAGFLVAAFLFLAQCPNLLSMIKL